MHIKVQRYFGIAVYALKFSNRLQNFIKFSSSLLDLNFIIDLFFIYVMMKCFNRTNTVD